MMHSIKSYPGLIKPCGNQKTDLSFFLQCVISKKFFFCFTANVLTLLNFSLTGVVQESAQCSQQTYATEIPNSGEAGF